MVRALTMALGDRPTAEDAAQEAFGRAFVRWRRVSEMDRPAAWVYVVALRYARRHHGPPTAELPSHAVDQPDDGLTFVVNRVLIADLLALLTARQRQAVVLRYHADLSLEQVAKALGCRVGTVKATLHQSFNVLRKAMENDSRDANT